MKKAYFMMLMLGVVTMMAIPAEAIIIDHGTYLTDTATNLDWLDVSPSRNLSFNDVSGQFSSGGTFEGWRYATGLEFNQLIGNWVGAPISGYARVYFPINTITGLIALLGPTYTYESVVVGIEGFIDDHSTSGRTYTAQINYYNDGYVNEEWTQAHAEDALSNYSAETIGSFLVRTSSTAPVPEPATMLLLASGLVGLAGMRRKFRLR